MKFFSFWRSLASFRVRIALNLKGLPARRRSFVDLDADAHHADAYRQVNPQMALPALVLDDGTTLFQSLAILEYLASPIPRRRCCPPIRTAARGPRTCADRRLRGPSAAGATGAALSRSRLNLRGHTAGGVAAALDDRDAGRTRSASRRSCGYRAVLSWRYADMADICMVGHVSVAVTQQINLAPYPR